MAIVDNVTRIKQTDPNLELIRAALTATGTSTFVSKFGTIFAVFVQEEGTNGATYTWTGSTVTITGTDTDYINMMIWGTE